MTSTLMCPIRSSRLRKSSAIVAVALCLSGFSTACGSSTSSVAGATVTTAADDTTATTKADDTKTATTTGTAYHESVTTACKVFGLGFAAGIEKGTGSTDPAIQNAALVEVRDEVKKAITSLDAATIPDESAATFDKMKVELSNLSTDLDKAKGDPALTADFFDKKPASVGSAIAQFSGHASELGLTDCEIDFA